MIWLTWRQHRIEILVMGIVLLLFATILLVSGVNIASEAQKIGFAGCISQHTTTCLAARGTLANYVNNITESSSTFYLLCIVLPLILPVLAGMFIGAHAIAREFEQGTYRLIWTQGIPWSRWLLTKIGLIIIVVLCAFSILFGLFSWWSFPLTTALKGYWNIDFSNHFDGWGIVAIAYALFALTLGIFTGTAIRKTVPAMAITLVIFVAVRILIVNFWRPYFLPPVVMITPVNAGIQIPAGSWILSDDTVNRQGQPVSIDALQVCNALLSPNATSTTQYDRCITDHGFQNKLAYQPADRFWFLQAIESSIYLFLAVILVAMTFWWTKYRIIGT